MATTAIELQTRTANLLRALEALLPSVRGEQRGDALAVKLVTACRDMEAGYRHACSSSSPDEFVARISHVARNARKTKATLMLLTQLDYLAIAETRDLIIEARALENVFVASSRTAKRRRRQRALASRS